MSSDLFEWAQSAARNSADAHNNNSAAQTTEPPAAISVSEANKVAKRLLEKHCLDIRIQGEISGWKLGPSGHAYFSLRDRKSSLPAVCFQRDLRAHSLALRDGLSVVVSGRLTIYEPAGRYQLVVRRFALDGMGEWLARFEETKKRLQAEGLTDPARKRALPSFPKRVGVITSPHGAALRDIIEVARRRYEVPDLTVFGAVVQGGQGVPSILAALKRAYQYIEQKGELDVLIIARGGGSIEDLWCFNDIQIARFIAESPVPVVSGVGHETDFTIADFVADHRAPTPSAAAEQVFPVRDGFRQWLSELRQRAESQLAQTRQGLVAHLLKYQLKSPELMLARSRSEVDSHAARARRATVSHVGSTSKSLVRLAHRLREASPRRRWYAKHQNFASLCGHRVLRPETILKPRQEELHRLSLRLESISPLTVLKRGYALVTDSEGRLVSQSGQVHSGDGLHIRLGEGALEVKVIDTKPSD